MLVGIMHKFRFLPVMFAALAGLLVGFLIGRAPTSTELFLNDLSHPEASIRQRALDTAPIDLSEVKITPQLLLLLQDPVYKVRVSAVGYMFRRFGDRVPRPTSVITNNATSTEHYDYWDECAARWYRWLQGRRLPRVGEAWEYP